MRSLGGERWRGGSDGRPEWQPSEAGHWQGLSDRWAKLSVCPGATLPQALLTNPSFWLLTSACPGLTIQAFT